MFILVSNHLPNKMVYLLYLYLFMFYMKRANGFPLNLNTINTNDNLIYTSKQERKDLLERNSVENMPETFVNINTNIIDDIAVPKYMLELYERSKTEKSSQLLYDGNTVRSYFNKGMPTNRYQFYFNLSDIDMNKETVKKAEFRIFKYPNKIKRPTFCYIQVSIKDVFTNEIVASNILNCKAAGWQTFPITNLIKNYVTYKQVNHGFLLSTELIYGAEEKIKFSTNTDKSNKVLLIVYTKDENDITLASLTNTTILENNEHKINTNKNKMTVENNIFNIFNKRKRRDLQHNNYVNRQPCQLKTLNVPTDKIGWNHKIIEPQIFKINQCVGTCLHDPSKANKKQTNHAILQALYTAVTDGQYSSYPCCAPVSFENDQALMRQGETIKVVVLAKLRVTSCACL